MALKLVEPTRGGYVWSLSTEVATLTRREKEKVARDGTWMLLQMQFLTGLDRPKGLLFSHPVTEACLYSRVTIHKLKTL